jgi:PAS domain S-box-containing protein
MDTEIEHSLRQSISQKLDVRGEFFIPALNCWIFLSSTATPDGVIILFYDITESKLVEERLKESKELFAQTAMATPDAITIYNLGKKQPVYLNNCLGQWVGYSNEELVAMGIEGRLNLVHPDDRQKLLDFNERMLKTGEGEVVTLEYRLTTKSGRTIWIHNRSKVFQRNEDGVVTEVLSVLQDVTKEHKLREELTRRTEFLEALIDNSVSRIMAFDTSFNLVAWNKRCEEAYKQTKKQAIGKSIFEFFPKIKEDAIVMDALHRSMNGEMVYVPPRQEIYAAGYSENFYMPLKNGEGKVYAVLYMMNDVTRIYEAREELKELNRTMEQKNRELEQKNEEITNFAFVASHDLKEPLRKIHTFCDWLLEREGAKLTQQGKDYIRKMANSVRRMDALIEDIMVLTKVHSDQVKEDKVDLNVILQQVQVELKEAIATREAEIDADELMVLHGNSNQLLYLFKNLVSNAIKFQAAGNTPYLKISSEVIKGSEIKDAKANENIQYVKISFADNGIGFDAKYDKKIFQVFQRLHSLSEFEGTGIGLAICKKIMENHHGFIAADSEPGKGSVFNCYFPLS